MKIKTIAKALACATALSVAVSSSAFAAAPTMTATRAGSNVTVNYSGITGQMTLLAFDITDAYNQLTGAENTTYVDQEIIYVTQEDAGSTKSFAVKDGWAPTAENESKYLLVKVGGTDIDTPAAQVVPFEYQSGEQFKYGDINADNKIDMNDAFEIVRFVQEKSDWDKTSVNFAAADVAESYGVVNMDDAFEIVRYVQEKITAFGPADENGYGTFAGTAAASVEEPEKVVEPEESSEVVEPEEVTEPETPAEETETVEPEEVTEETEEVKSEETTEETETEPEAEVEAEAEAE